jgi:hypothetical protein
MSYRKPTITICSSPIHLIRGQHKISNHEDMGVAPPHPNNVTSGAYEADE